MKPIERVERIYTHRSVADKIAIVKKYFATPYGRRSIFLVENEVGYSHIYYWKKKHEIRCRKSRQ